MQLAQTGDEVAYALLLKELSQVISVCLKKQFGNASFIDDCVQESLIAIHSARHTYNHKMPFKPWMNALIKYKTIDVLRKQKTYLDNLISDENDSDHQSYQNDKINTYNIEDHLTGTMLLKRLPKIYLEPLVFTKLIGLSVAETAEELNISQSAVKQRVKRAINKTQALFKKEQL